MDAGGQTRQEHDPSLRKGELHQLHGEPQHQSLCGGKGSAWDMADQALKHREGACLEEEQAGKATIATPPQNKQSGGKGCSGLFFWTLK